MREPEVANPFRSPYVDPESLTFMAAAFNDAWFIINARSPVALALQPSARDYLGHVVLSLWQQGSRDALAIEAAAQYMQSPRWGLA